MSCDGFVAYNAVILYSTQYIQLSSHAWWVKIEADRQKRLILFVNTVSHLYAHIVHIFQQKRSYFSKLDMGFIEILCVA